MPHYEYIAEFASFLNRNQIPYKKRKDGLPNMRYATTKAKYDKFVNDMKQQEQKTVKKTIDLSSIEDDDDDEHFIHEHSVQTKIDTFECVICMDNISDNICLLKCKHSFCVSCFAQHMRHNGDCPLCRDSVTEKPKKLARMPTETVELIAEYAMTAPPGSNSRYRNITECIVDIHKTYYNGEMPKFEATRDIVLEIQNYGFHVGTYCCSWYDSSI